MQSLFSSIIGLTCAAGSLVAILTGHSVEGAILSLGAPLWLILSHLEEKL